MKLGYVVVCPWVFPTQQDRSGRNQLSFTTVMLSAGRSVRGRKSTIFTLAPETSGKEARRRSETFTNGCGGPGLPEKHISENIWEPGSHPGGCTRKTYKGVASVFKVVGSSQFFF